MHKKYRQIASGVESEQKAQIGNGSSLILVFPNGRDLSSQKLGFITIIIGEKRTLQKEKLNTIIDVDWIQKTEIQPIILYHRGWKVRDNK